ncbi:MAG: NAD(P)/FAD-dependent oxidoreductase [Candidatus Binataceae bacterium]
MNPLRERYDVAIVGAGVIGSALAMALGERGLRSALIDLDLSGRLSSSERNAGGVRATWWQPVNIALCRASIRYYESIRAEVGFRQKGYLILYDDARWEEALRMIPVQRELDHPIETLTATEVAQRVPEIDHLDGIAGATFSAGDGLINPNLLKLHYREKARESGAQLIDATYVYAIETAGTGVRLACWHSDAALNDVELDRMLTQDGPGEPALGRLLEIAADAVAITVGAWAPNVLKLVGLDSPTRAVRRQLCTVDCRATNLEPYGMIFDTSGVYFHNDGPHILAGYSPPEEPAGYSFKFDGEEFFQREIWPRMYARASCFERVRYLNGWAGLYEMTPDRSGIVGRARDRVFEAHSFSAHGVMQSYAVGQALANLIATGSYGRLDASALRRERFTSGPLMYEELHW